MQRWALHQVRYILKDVVNRLVDDIGRTGLHEAARGGHLDIVKELLKLGADVNIQDRDDFTALHFACHCDFIYNVNDNERYEEPNEEHSADIVRELLKHGADSNLQDEKGHTPLQGAAFYGYHQTVHKLLKHNADPNLQDRHGTTALQYACSEGHNFVVKELLKYGANPNLQDKRGSTALHGASCGGYDSIVQELLNAGANPSLQDKRGYTALYLCLEQYQEESQTTFLTAIELLLQHPKTDVNMRNNAGEHPLVISLENQTYAGSHKLIQAGAEVVNLDNRKDTALHVVVANIFDCGDAEITLLNELLSHPKIQINQADCEGFTALHDACRFCHSTALTKLLPYLLDNGADISMRSKSGGNPLHYLCSEDQYDKSAHGALEVLAPRHLPTSVINSHGARGFTPLHHAISNKFFESAMKLLEFQGIEVNAKCDTSCETPLHRACAYVSVGRPTLVNLVKKLVAEGADISSQDSAGNTPLHVACSVNTSNETQRHQWEIIKLLLEKEGDHQHTLNHFGLSPLMAAASRKLHLDLIFQMLTHTGGTILECATANGDENPKKRSHLVAFEQERES